MEPTVVLPILLVLAWLLPAVSFALIVFFGPRMGKAGHGAGYVATGAIAAGAVLSWLALAVWLVHNPLAAPSHGGEHAAAHQAAAAISGELYTLGQFGELRLSLGYHIDGLTVAMFAMVTLIATCIHVYSFGYMHEELYDVDDSLVTLSDGRTLKRRGRFHRFYQYLSLFCFSMLGLVLAGNLAMVFMFWEMVGICSYLLIGFYYERKSASNAANKAFIVNRIGDFGLIVGLMALIGGLGTLSFADYRDSNGKTQPGIFSQVRPAGSHHQLIVPDGMVRMAAREQVAQIYRTSPSMESAAQTVAERIPGWRQQGFGYGLLVVAGLGVFCGCVGKSAQFPLHVWLPDAMEGPTPVSALIHAATMVAAGVYLVGRFYPVFTPEVLMVIAVVGCLTLFIAATIALTATDIKRVLAYSTVSQLGYMMLALGVGGWIAGLFHLFTHAFFKSLLFLCSGSVIHATGTNEMPKMGGLLKKMPWTAGTMLVGCLAIAGAGVPLLIGLSGYHSKDAIIAQLFSFRSVSPWHAWMFYAATFGAGLTAFYMFRLWFMTFAGKPRDKHIFDHAHESPKVMYLPLVVLAAFAIVAGWRVPWTNLSLTNLLEQARPAGTAVSVVSAVWPSVAVPAESLSHATDIHVMASLIAFGVALTGFLLAVAFYGARIADPADAAKQFSGIYRFLCHKWWFDELYRFLFVRPTLRAAEAASDVDRKGIDWIADNIARGVRGISCIDDWIDRLFVDGLVNGLARWTYAIGLGLRNLQTGRLRQYVVLVAVGTVALFVLVSLVWNSTPAGL
jgi:NADH-quinone oxidoreductase subunit L